LNAIFLEVVESRSPIRYFTHVGERVPLHATSSGRAILSIIPPKERATLLRKLDYVQFAPDSLMSPEEVEADIQKSIKRGWFLNVNGFIPDLLGVAMPLPLPDRQLCLLVAGPVFRVGDHLDELVAALRAEVDRYMADIKATGAEGL
jgi:DNA-binding IclR family transcriptional regulator